MKYLLLSLFLISCTDNSPMFSSYSHENKSNNSIEKELAEQDYKLQLESIEKEELRFKEASFTNNSITDSKLVFENKFNNEVSQEIKENKVGQFELNLGFHEIEYFADRLVLKAKRVGYDFGVKQTFVQNNRKFYKATLGPFNSYEEAETARLKIKAIVPDSIAEIIKLKN